MRKEENEEKKDETPLPPRARRDTGTSTTNDKETCTSPIQQIVEPIGQKPAVETNNKPATTTTTTTNNAATTTPTLTTITPTPIVNYNTDKSDELVLIDFDQFETGKRFSISLFYIQEFVCFLILNL